MKYPTHMSIALAIGALIIAPLAASALSPIKAKPKISHKAKTSLVISPKTAKQGQKVQATLKGFAPNSRLSVSIDSELGLTPYSFYSDKKGVGSISFTIPKSLPNNTYVLHATDAYNTLATTKIIVKGKQMPLTLRLDPLQGIAGTVVTFSGEGWLSKRHKKVSLKGYDDNDQEVLMSFEPDALEDLCASQLCGEYETKVRVQIPQDAQIEEGEETGIYELVFSDGYNSKTVEFTLVNAEIPPTEDEAKISLALSTISLGDPLTISGSGFKPHSGLLVKIGNDTYSIKRGPSSTDENGTFKASLIETPLKEGAYTVTVMDGLGNSAKESFTVRAVQFGKDPVGGGPEQKPILPPTPSPSPSPTLTPSPKPSPTPTLTPSPTPSPTPTVSQCPSGSTYSTTFKQCIQDVPAKTEQDKPTCPAGQTYSVTFKQCY